MTIFNDTPAEVESELKSVFVNRALISATETYMLIDRIAEAFTGIETLNTNIDGDLSSINAQIVKAVDYGVLADGTTDNVTFLQNAVDACVSGVQSGLLDKTVKLLLPQGVVKISAPIVCTSGLRLEGDGIGARISPTGGFVGDSLLFIEYGSVDICQDLIISNVSFDGAHIAITDKYLTYSFTGVALTNIMTATGHQFTDGEKVWVKPTTLTGGSGITTGREYYVRDVSGNTFKLAETLGGAAVDFTTNITTGTIETFPATNLRCKFNNLAFSVSDAIVLRNYCQDVYFTNLFSLGAINRFLHYSGNYNLVDGINKEGISGTNSEPYLKISHIYDGNRSTGNVVRRCNLEAGLSTNKTPMVFEGCDCLNLVGIWCETYSGNTDGYAMRFDDCYNVNCYETPLIQLTTGYNKIKIDNSVNIYFNQLYLDPSADNIYDVLDIDATSTVTVGTLFSRSNDCALRCNIAPNIRVLRVFSRNNYLVPYTSQVSETLYTGNNLFTNGSFENELHGWSIQTGATVTPTLVDSGVTFGKALQCTVSPANSLFRVYQTVTFLAEHVGKPFTFTGAVKTSAPNGCYIYPYVYGAGVDLSSTLVNFAREGDWTIISQTFVPQSAGTCDVGATCGSLTTAWLDEFSLVPGIIGTLSSSSFKSLEVNGRSVTVGTGIPTANQGMWRVGDIRLNSAPSADEYAGWMCTVASASTSDPGTWVGFGTLSATKKIYGTAGGRQIELDSVGRFIHLWNEATNIGYKVYQHTNDIIHIDTDAYQIRNRQTGDIIETWSSGGGRVFNTPTDILIKSSTPASASAAGVAGNVVYSADYIYVCVATNTWKRVALSTW